MKKEITITAKDKAAAIEEALQYFSKELKQDVTVKEVKLVKMNEKSGFLGFGKKNEYVIRYVDDTEAQGVSSEDGFALNPNLDGYFQLKVRDSGIYLRVIGPQGNGKVANLNYIKQMIEEKELIDVNFDLVEKTYEEATGEDVMIAERKPELDRDASLEITISSDAMTAYCTYIPPLGGNKLSFTDAVKLLNKKGVKYGIDEKRLQWLLDENTQQETVIAKGTPPVDGKPAELRFHFQLPDQQKRVKELEDGKVDYHNLDLVINVLKGDLLVTKLPSTSGVPGCTVRNEEVKPNPGKDVRLPKGKHVEVGIDEMSLFANIDGQVAYDGERVNVLPVFTIDGDVDLETGNIDFVGNVIVKGNVQEGFSIKAVGDIEVMGNVGGAYLEAEGSVIVRKGFQGKQKGLIKANGDVHINFVENGQIFTRGSLYVNGAIMHSTVVAKIDVLVEGRGLIVGGSVQAGNDITAKMIGSHLATPTEIMAGSDPEVRQQLDQLNIEIENATENFDKVVKGLELLRKAEKQLGGLPADKYAVLSQFDTTRCHLQSQMNGLMQQREMLLKQLKEQKNGRIKVLDRIHPGVRLTIGQAGYRVKDSLARTVFVYDEGEVRPRPL